MCIRDRYNADPSFAIPDDHAKMYRERIAKNIRFFDRIDGRTDWTDTDRMALAALLTDDFLVVDISRPCEKSSYFEIERSLFAHTPHKTCGGRKPAEDIMDVLYEMCIRDSSVSVRIDSLAKV